MKFVIVLIALSLLTVGRSAAVPPLDEEQLRDLETRFPFFVMIPATSSKPLRYVYADAPQHLHVFALQSGGKSKPVWETASLGSPISALELVEDRSGETVLLVATLGGRILVYDLDDYRLRYEHFQDRFQNITCLKAENLDDDPQTEVVFISERYLYVYDGDTRFMEWKSTQQFDATEILIANVDDDPQLEIILNSGAIVDSRFRELEVESRDRKNFGRRIRLVDLNGDGYPEIIGETGGFPLTIFDIRRRQEIW